MEHLQTPLSIQCAQLSHAGIKTVNEDSIGIRIPEGPALVHKGALAVIADGVSAAEAGQEASQACVQNLLNDYYCTPDTWTVTQSILAVVNALNRWLYSQGSHLPQSEKGFVTTLTLVVFKAPFAHIFHIGDSRVYRLRNDNLECLTKDHCKQVGKVKYLARAMGLDTKIQMDYRKEELQSGDLFMLTTDGVHDFLSDQWLLDQLKKGTDKEAVIEAIFKAALAEGSDDNMSCQLLQMTDVSNEGIEETYNSLSNLPFPPLFKPGQSVDGLTIVKTLYESNRSQLYLVEEAASKKRYVMKTPSVNFEDDPAYIERFIMESWLGRRIRHSKLVPVINRPDHPSCLYYLMRHVEGITLEQWMKKTANPSISQVVRLTRQIANGLRALHRQGVVHQDVKPSNMMINEHDQVVIIDYGSCTMASMSELPSPFEREIALGTASYSAPECHLRQTIDKRADIFSLAVVLFEMLTGRLPFNHKLQSISKPADLKKCIYQPAYEINPYVPKWFDHALRKAMELDPAHRYQSMDEFLQDLENPNPLLDDSVYQPIIARNPLKFWQGVALVEGVAILWLLAEKLEVL